MIPAVDHTHAPALSSWVESSQAHADYPIQNLPLCIFSTASDRARRAGVVIGNEVLDLDLVRFRQTLEVSEQKLLAVCQGETLNGFLRQSASIRLKLRHFFSRLLSEPRYEAALRPALTAQRDCMFHLPVAVGDYTDFFAGIHHATNAGRLFRPDNPLLPNYKHVPIAYHGRSSSIRSSGQCVIRPSGQRGGHGATMPSFGPTRRLDYELELALWVARETELGTTIPIDEAEEHIAAFGLLNDWSARDVQAWETQPLGPFLGKNFMTSVSPFLVTSEALAPFRTKQPARAEGDPSPLPYLASEADQAGGAIDLRLEVYLSTTAMRKQQIFPHRLTRASTLDLYWTPAQMVTHHASNGCNLRPGDLFGTGTISSPAPDGHGSLLELTQGGKSAFQLPTGETRQFLEDGDEIIMRGWAEKPGFARIGLGEVRGIIEPSQESDRP